MLKLGSGDISALRLGGDEVKRVYLGDDLVFDAAPPVTTCTITASIDPEGSGAVTGAGQYQAGETVTLAAAVNGGYSFTGWQENGATVSTDNPYTFTAEGDRSLTAACKAARLPAGYTELEYIASPNGQCVIDTGQKLQKNIKTVIDFEPLSAPTSTDAMIVWNYYGSAALTYSTEWLNSGSLSGVAGLIGYGANWKTVNANTTPRRMTVEMDNNTGTIKADGQSVTFAQQVYNAGSPNVFLFGTSGGAMTLKAKLYSCKIYLGSSAARDFVPCKNPSGVVGLYDLVTKAFFKSTTSTAFVAGPAV